MTTSDLPGRPTPVPDDRTLLMSIDNRGVATVTLNRPEVLNAFDEALIGSIESAFELLSARADVRVVVLRSTGRVFCAGADIGWMRRAAANEFESNLEDARKFAAMMAAIDRCPKPVVACVQGAAYGGGVGLVCSADVVVAAQRARFSVSEAKFGILPAVIGPYLVNAVGVRQARRLALTCAVVGAMEALAIGLVHELVDDAELDEATERHVRRLLSAAPAAQSEIKRLFACLSVGPIDPDIRDLTARTIARVRACEEARLGFQAFDTGTSPPWAIDP